MPRRALRRRAGLQQQFGGRAVRSVSFDCIKRLVDGAANDGVEELERILAPQEVKPNECGSGRTKLACFHAGKSGRVAQLGPVAEDRGRTEKGKRLRRQAGEAKPDRARNALRSDLHQKRHMLGSRARSLPCNRVQHRADEERIPAGRRLEGGAESLVRPQTVQLARQHGDRGTPKRFGANRDGLRIGDELCHKGGIAALPLRRPRRRNDEERHSLEPSRQVEQPPQRGAIRPVQIVDREQRRLLKGNVGGEPVEAVEDRERALRGRVLGSGERRGAKQRFHERGRPREQLRAEIRRDGRERRLEQLTNDPVRKPALELASAGCEHPHPRRARNRTALGKQTGLADTGTSLDDGKPPAAAPRRVSQCLQRRDLGLTLQEQDGASARRKNTRRRHHDQSVEPSEPTV